MNASIHSRIIYSAFFILVLFLGLTGAVLDKAFRHNAQSAQKDNLRTQIYTLLATAELGDDNQLVLPADITEPRLNIAESNLYARVVKTDGQPVWQSRSMVSKHVKFPLHDEIGEFKFDVDTSANGNYTILSFVTIWVTDKGEQGYLFQVAESQSVLSKQISTFRTNLFGWLAGVGVVLLIVQGFILNWGLLPLRHVAQDLLKIEQGEATELSGTYPKELTPLTNNLNQLLASANQQLVRYRDALGNMAHSLKTPIAVLRGILDSESIKQKQIASEQLDSINNIVEYQLQRAATAGRRALDSSVNLLPVAQKIINTLNKVYRDKNISAEASIPEDLLINIDEGDLFEMLGNLLDNAYKWSNHQIRLSADFLNNKTRLIIEDDGPGIEQQQRDRILLRGQRADENTPGHGLGMAMVNDMLLLYDGRMEISDSKLGGAKITITL